VPHDLILLKTAEKEIEKLIDKNKEVDDLLKIKFVALRSFCENAPQFIEEMKAE